MEPQLSLESGYPALIFPNGRRLEVNFVEDRHRYWKTLRGKQELIAKAVGFSPKKSPVIFDATLGLAEDAWTLARLGAQVIGSEREPLLFQLLQSAKTAALTEEKTRAVATRIEIHRGEALEILAQVSQTRVIDTVFLDPMFPETKKTALPRLEMQLLREWLGGKKDDIAELFTLALSLADRVVVKRPLHAPELSSQAGQSFARPVHQYKGKSVRYDLYQRVRR